jgi:hypothetical protein
MTEEEKREAARLLSDAEKVISETINPYLRILWAPSDARQPELSRGFLSRHNFATGHYLYS